MTEWRDPAGPAPASPSVPRAVPLTDLSERRRTLESLANGPPTDLIVVGGGITGASAAWLAAEAGQRVVLVEREDFGSGASGATSKMLHGGLRYLARGHLRLVREALRERGRLSRELGPERARVMPFSIPLRNSWGSRATLRAGTWVYQRLAGSYALGPRQVLRREGLSQIFPQLALGGTRGAIRYYEAIVDDVLLTLDRVRRARRAGAIAFSHLEALRPLLRAGRAEAIEVEDHLTGDRYHLPTRSLLNAGGAWAPLWVPRGIAPPMAPSQGIHLVFRRSRAPLAEGLVLAAPDRRWVFAFPFGPFTILGTTDTPWPDIRRPGGVTDTDVAYLLRCLQEAFPSWNLGPGDICDTYAGLRPLLAGPTDRPTSELSREDAVHRGLPNAVTVVGGKLTTHRPMALRALKALGIVPKPVGTGPQDPSTKGSGPADEAPPVFSPCEIFAFTGAAAGEVPEAELRRWVRWALRGEPGLTLEDILDRRFHLLNRQEEGFPHTVREIARVVAQELGISEPVMMEAVARYLESHRRDRLMGGPVPIAGAGA
jgi:glycerol-3-phosphate dehydrogenase